MKIWGIGYKIPAVVARDHADKGGNLPLEISDKVLGSWK